MNGSNTLQQLNTEEIKLKNVYKRFKLFFFEVENLIEEINLWKYCRMMLLLDEKKEMVKIISNYSTEGLEYLYTNKMLVELNNTTNKSLLYSMKFNKATPKNDNSKLIEERILEIEKKVNTTIVNDMRMKSLIKCNSEIYYFDYIHKLDNDTSILSYIFIIIIEIDIDEVLDRCILENKTNLDFYYCIYINLCCRLCWKMWD